MPSNKYHQISREETNINYNTLQLNHKLTVQQPHLLKHYRSVHMVLIHQFHLPLLNVNINS